MVTIRTGSASVQANKMRLLVFGKTGQLASELQDLCSASEHEAVFLDSSQADLTNPSVCAQVIADCTADIVINAAAYTAVDQAEDELPIAQLINATSPTEMAREAARRKIPFLHISTDYVFDGTAEASSVEDDQPNPQGVYGRTKLAGEAGVAACGGDHVILRTAWVFSSFGANFVKTMRRLAGEHDALKVVNDQRGGPTPARDVAATLLKIAEAFTRGAGVSGIYHYCGAPSVSWAQFANAIFADQPAAPRVTGIPSSEYPTRAKRPMNSTLNCTKIYETYNIKQPDWHAGLREVLDKLEAEI